LIVDIELFVIATCPRERYFGARGARDAPLSSQGICVSEVTLVILRRPSLESRHLCVRGHAGYSGPCAGQTFSVIVTRHFYMPLTQFWVGLQIRCKPAGTKAWKLG